MLDEDEVSLAMGGRVLPPPEKIRLLPPSKLACPRDGEAMRCLRHLGVEVEICAECRGLWLDAGEIEKIRQLSRDGPKRGAAVAAGVAAGAVGGTAVIAGDAMFDGAIDLAIEFVASFLEAEARD
jgi:hypothetical protein